LKLTEPRREVFLVTNLDSLAKAASAIRDVSEIGLDAERASGFKYSNRAYLVQFSTADSIFLLDPTVFSQSDLNSLIETVNQKLWILHSATQDIPCLRELGFSPSAIYDTELAARICGIEKFGLSSIALELLDLEMEKEHSAADWSQRPLSAEMLNYAALDVDVLHDLKSSLDRKVKEMGRAHWLDQELIRLLSFKPKPQPKDAWRSLPGITKIKDERKLKIAASLYQKRDEIAREKDIAPGRLIPDRSIMAAVDQLPQSKRDLARNRDFQGRASRSLLDDWWNAVQNSESVDIAEQELDPNHLPNHRSWERRFPEAHLRLSTLRPIVLAKAQELEIAPEILLSPDALRRVCFKPEADLALQLKTLGARDWQIELLAPELAAALLTLSD
jgi:ribonuclease D